MNHHQGRPLSSTAAVRHLQSTETSHASAQCLASFDKDVPASLEHWRDADLIAITRLQHATAELGNIAHMLRMDGKVCVAASRCSSDNCHEHLRPNALWVFCFRPGPATSSRRLDLSARASDLPAELVQTAVDTGHRRRATNGERRIFIARR